MSTPRPSFTHRLRPELARTAELMPALSRPLGALVLPAGLRSFQAFANKVHAKAGPRRR